MAEKNAVKEVKKSKNHPTTYDFTKVGDLQNLRISRNGKDKKVADQLQQIVKFVKDHKITKIGRKEFYDKVNAINTTEDKKLRADFKEKYPALEKSVQTIQAVSNFYWVRGDMKKIGVVGLNA